MAVQRSHVPSTVPFDVWNKLEKKETFTYFIKSTRERE